MTGDLIDNAMLREINWFKEIADGRLPWNYDDIHMEPLADGVEGLNLDWYAAWGNHDRQVNGCLPANLMELLHPDLSKAHGFNIAMQDELIDVIRDSSSEPAGHGFASGTGATDGYYSFDLSPFVKIVVLNTATDNWAEGYRDYFKGLVPSAGFRNAEEQTGIFL
ncbi:MAG: hypothetical protein GY761_21205, partial [Hyphomicrobiales bacterium]|nr:hypothetical protein [Hyphomicrobiales bacterium]